MDYYRVSGEAIDRSGATVLVSLDNHERDSEVVPRAMKFMELDLACYEAELTLLSISSIEYIERPEDYSDVRFRVSASHASPASKDAQQDDSLRNKPPANPHES
jgi:hypothetical protein